MFGTKEIPHVHGTSFQRERSILTLSQASICRCETVHLCRNRNAIAFNHLSRSFCSLVQSYTRSYKSQRLVSLAFVVSYQDSRWIGTHVRPSLSEQRETFCTVSFVGGDKPRVKADDIYLPAKVVKAVELIFAKFDIRQGIPAICLPRMLDEGVICIGAWIERAGPDD